jgi:hypothetical protein
MKAPTLIALPSVAGTVVSVATSLVTVTQSRVAEDRAIMPVQAGVDCKLLARKGDFFVAGRKR